MSSQTHLLGYFFQAGPVVKSVMLLLLVASLSSWTLIFQRSWFLSAKQRQAKDFLEKFWQCKDVSTLFAQIDGGEIKNEGLAAVFHKGFKTYVQFRKSGAISVEAIARVMQNQQAREAGKLSKHLAFFASVGSIAPYVGLFGTVWGIMTSFQALGNARQATIAMVAPGISEALVATALGLFTAIPAVIAYNRYSNRVTSMLDEYELFQNEFMSMIELQTKRGTEG
ncbi:MAG: protein TolQ [Legionellaceae bacterium]|nr:protein TolQ [Legionellaceae bacterium]